MSRAAAALLALLLAGCASSGPELPVRRGHLQALALPPVNAAPYAPSPLQGHVVLVAFVATWCVPCLAQLPGLGKLQRELGAQGLRTVAVGMDLEGEEVLAPFAEYYALPFPLVAADERLHAGDSPFGKVGALPTFFLLDKRGEVLAAWEGMAAQDALEKTVRKALQAP
jgi:thiol-disulfide isomerase/thioredoxin